jgi:hypothetical protein
MLKYIGLATAFAGVAFGLTAPGINGQTIVSLLMWIVGVVVYLRGRKIEMDEERAMIQAAEHAAWAEGIDRGVRQMALVHGSRR